MVVFILLQASLLYTFCWVILRLLRRYVFERPFDNIPGPSSDSFLAGNFPQVFNPDAWNYHRKLTETYGSIVSLHSFFGGTALFVSDPTAMTYIMLKDQDVYERSPLMIGIGGLTMGEGLLNATGERHRRQKKMLSPIFNAAHMRDMGYSTLLPGHGPCEQKGLLKENDNNDLSFWLAQRHPDQKGFNRSTEDRHVRGVKLLLDSSHLLKRRKWVGRTSLELIGQAGLGFSFDQLTEDGAIHEYSYAMKNLVPTLSRMQLAGLVVFPWGLKLGPPKFRRFIVDVIPWGVLRKARDLVDVMYGTTSDIYRHKKEAFEQGDESVMQQVGNGRDIIAVLMKYNDTAAVEDKLSEREIIDQMSTLTFAAMDTTSSGIARILHVLAQHIDAQDKLREEIRQAHIETGAELTYNQLVHLPYMDAVCRETLRLYPPVPTVTRNTNADIDLPLKEPIKGRDEQDIYSILVPRDTTVLVSIMSLNRNPEIWGQDALEWKPERWLSSLPDSVKEAHIPGVYSNMMTFLGGSRACIGFKFSQLEMKVMLSVLINSFRFSLSEEKIMWEMSLVTNPSVNVAGGTERTAALPLNVATA